MQLKAKPYKTIEELLDDAHNLAMDKHPQTACFGRATKEILPVFDTWFKTEQDRGTPVSDLLWVLVAMLAHVIINFGLNAAVKSKSRELAVGVALSVLNATRDICKTVDLEAIYDE